MKSNKQKEARLTSHRLKELLDYSSTTGVFTWLAKSSIHTHNIKVGDIAGSVNKGHGYLSIWIDGYCFLAHRLAWFYTYGEFPQNVINHKNRNKIDNRLENLEDVVQQANNQNRSKQVRQDTNLPTGIVAVSSKSKLDKTSLISYYAHWTDTNGKLMYSPFFNIKKCGGDSFAKDLAIVYRRTKIRELNSLGASYTEGHGM